MGFLRDIVETWIRPAQVVRRKLAAGLREEKLLAYVIFAAMIALMVRIPALVSEQQAATEPKPLDALVAGSIVAYLLFGPLFLYLLAALSHMVARLARGKGSWQGARLALFWSLLALQPLVALSAFLVGLAPWGWVARVAPWALAGGFVWVWLSALAAVERPSDE